MRKGIIFYGHTVTGTKFLLMKIVKNFFQYEKFICFSFVIYGLLFTNLPKTLKHINEAI